MLPLAWEIARRPRPGVDPLVIWAVVAGLIVTFVLGGATGMRMTARGSHLVGRDAWHVPLLGWSLTTGNLRIAHFLGIHAMQALPLIAVVATYAARGWGKPLFPSATAGYIMLILALMYLANDRYSRLHA